MGLLFNAGQLSPQRGTGGGSRSPLGAVFFSRKRNGWEGRAKRSRKKRAPGLGALAVLLVHVVYQGQELLGGDLGPVDGVVRLWGGAGVDEVHVVAV